VHPHARTGTSRNAPTSGNAKGCRFDIFRTAVFLCRQATEKFFLRVVFDSKVEGEQNDDNPAEVDDVEVREKHVGTLTRHPSDKSSKLCPSIEMQSDDEGLPVEQFTETSFPLVTVELPKEDIEERLYQGLQHQVPHWE